MPCPSSYASVITTPLVRASHRNSLNLVWKVSSAVKDIHRASANVRISSFSDIRTVARHALFHQLREAETRKAREQCRSFLVHNGSITTASLNVLWLLLTTSAQCLL